MTFDLDDEVTLWHVDADLRSRLESERTAAWDVEESTVRRVHDVDGLAVLRRMAIPDPWWVRLWRWLWR